jgi:hypothetical protein
MLAAIKLYYELASWAGGIGNEPADRVLTSEPPRQTALAQSAP